ncbi:MAG: hypothetical protein HZA60_08945 [Deltaproteobacteria bacterium]|nr:hypothetical protein [Deltaproteobacteria bacterium]
MLKLLTDGIKEWLVPAVASRMILIEGGVLFVKCDTYFTRSLSLYAMRVYVPGVYTYGVEYRLAEGGEFRVTAGKNGGVVARSKYVRSCSIPVCWLPKRFLGKDVDRYIIRIDGKRVNMKAGMKESLRKPGSGKPPVRSGDSHNRPAGFPRDRRS